MPDRFDLGYPEIYGGFVDASAARAGFGLAYLSEWNVAADLAAGSRLFACWMNGHRPFPACLSIIPDVGTYLPACAL